MTQQTFHFQQLSPDTILDAIESVGIYPESGLLPLNSYENRVYQFKADDGQRYVTKFYRPERWSQAQIQEEHDFAFELMSEEVPVVAPIQRDGQSLFTHKDFWFCLFPSVGGRIFEVDNLDQLEWMGRFIGRMHGVAKRKPFQYRPEISIQEYLHDARRILLEKSFVPQTLEVSFYTILEQVIQAVEPHFVDYQSQRLHGDCHSGNILWCNDAPVFVDLDDARSGPAIQDLWMMLSGDRQQQLIQLETLIESYEEFSPFNMQELKLIEPLRALRIVHYMGWLAKRWEDPAFPRNFSWFAQDKYWEQQILILKEQLAALHEEPLTLMPGNF
ncbi:serine/threonine protein kinase [Algicola sagamiensis]|uniref:serine/threonine protein kinase n=1 Tax=Algicola sagamiensis TaxID=163869 RepID=UPI000362BD1A|nr:serine/threonine protein kinase [Algicola sagamiensis]